MSALSTVWWSVVAMLGLCIPLVAVTRITLLPVFVLAAGVVATAIVLGGQRSSRSARADMAERERLETRIRELEERLANVEVIESFEDRLAEKELARRHGDPAVEPHPPSHDEPSRRADDTHSA